MIAAGRALLGDVACSRVECSPLAPEPATSQNASEVSVMIDAAEAASALGITPKALHKRVQRGMYLTGHGLRYVGKTPQTKALEVEWTNPDDRDAVTVEAAQ